MAGTVAEILSTLPELVVIGFLIPVISATAFVIALVTIYNDALVFIIYSFFLPKDRHGKFLMLLPITGAGTQILIASAAVGLIPGLVMMARSFSEHQKKAFLPVDLFFIGILMLGVFCIYFYELFQGCAREEDVVSDALELTDRQIEKRRALAYARVRESSWTLIAGYFLVAVSLTRYSVASNSPNSPRSPYRICS